MQAVTMHYYIKIYYQNNFFNFIHSVFGPHAKSLLKEWIKLNKTYIRSTLRERFLKFCITKNIVPTHLNCIYKSKLMFQHPKIRAKFNHNINLFINRTLRLEFNDTCRLINSFRTRIFHLARSIANYLPHQICDFFSTYNMYHYNAFIILEDVPSIKKCLGCWRNRTGTDSKIFFLYNIITNTQTNTPTRSSCLFPILTTCFSFLLILSTLVLRALHYIQLVWIHSSSSRIYHLFLLPP